jgi:hypothetical protein
MQHFGRSLAVLATSSALLFAPVAPVAVASTGDAAKAAKKDDGTITVCKIVKSRDNRKREFDFRIRSVDHDKGKAFDEEFTLEVKNRKECSDEYDVEKGRYRVRETDLPKGCEFKDIDVDGADWYRVNEDRRLAVVRVGKGDDVTVTFTNRCKKDGKDEKAA